MKRLPIITLFFVLLFLINSSYVSAVCSNANQLIMKLSSNTNAHGAIYSDANYLTEICYNDIFGIDYTGASPQNCAGGNANLVLTLSSNTNAHANGPLQAPYPFFVCYGDLACQLRDTACSGSEREIVSLATPTNSHLEIASLNNYNYRVCCTSAAAGGSGAICGNGVVESGEQCDGTNLSGQSCTTIPGGFTGGNLACYSAGTGNQCTFNTAGCTGATSKVEEVHWEDFAGNKIGRSVSIGTYVNRTVRVVASTTFAFGTIVTFDINEDDSIVGDSFDDNIKTLTTQTDNSGRAASTFKITDGDIKNGSDWLEGTSQEFYFTASAGNSNNRSEIVDVNENQGPNTPPVANITAPIHRGVYYNSTTVLFNQSSYDSESDLKYNWTIAEDDYKDNRSSFMYIFKKPGIKTVTLRVTDDRGAWDEQEIAILVVASPGMLAYINHPFNKEIVPPQIIGSGRSLNLDYAANDSFVINNNVINGGTCATGLTCLAGNCPSQTQNSPNYCPGPGGPIPINGTPKTFAETTFNWTLGNDQIKRDGIGDSYALGSRRFAESQAGPQSISLILSYNNTIVGISQNTNRFFTIGQCIDNGHIFIRINPFTNKEVSRGDTTSSEYCTGQDTAVGGGDDCCPAGFSCGSSGGATKCYGIQEDSCADFSNTNQTTCENVNPSGFPEYISERCGEVINGSIMDCHCSWKDIDTSCFLNVTSRPIDNCGGQSCNNPPTNYQCLVLSYNEHECINGYADVDIIRLFINGTGYDDPYAVNPPCINETITGVLCGRPSFDLDILSDWTILISATFIAGIYVVFYAFRKNEKQ